MENDAAWLSNPEGVLKACVDMLDGLSHLHDTLKIVHRDCMYIVV